MKKGNKFKGKVVHTKNFDLILDFYLFNCPCVRTIKSSGTDSRKIPISQRGFTLDKYGFAKQKLNKLFKSMKKDLSGRIYSYKDEISFQKSDLPNSTIEFVAYAKRSDMSNTATIFYMIRNALAHGSFRVEKNTYYFVSEKNNKTKAQMKLKETTLLKWMNEIQNGRIDTI